MERIGRYKILEEVGRGAMGIVYRAQDPAIGRTVAIKTIRLSDLADANERAKLRERLFREAQSAGVLSHPGIVTIYDVAEEGDLAYIAMEFVDGPTLDRMLASDPPDGPLVLSILSQTAAALDYAHKRGIVHRDIKPSNIMMHERTTAKITDFGVARIQSHQMTHAGAMVGTPNYMSPEQIQGQMVSGSSDQFSLAVIAYELLTGEKPFGGDSMPTLVFKIVNEQPVAAHRLNGSLSWTVDTVLKRALAKSTADRYPTCSDFIFALENACRASKGWKPAAPGVSTSLPTVAPTVHPEAKKHVRSPEPAPPAFLNAHDERPSAFLRIARAVALVIVGGGIVSALLVGALRYFSPDFGAPTPVPEAEPAAESQPPKPETPKPETPKPETPVSDPPAEPAATLPPDSVKSTPNTPQQPAIGGEPAPVRLVTNPPGAFVVIDGRSELSCTSPCTLSLAPGRHTLAATKEGYRRTLRILEPPTQEEVFLNLDRIVGTVAVRSEPRGASIYVDGQLRPEKTPAVLALPVGAHSIELVHNESREKQEVMVRDSVITNLTVDLSNQ